MTDLEDVFTMTAEAHIAQEATTIAENMTGCKIFGFPIDVTNISHVMVAAYFFGLMSREGVKNREKAEWQAQEYPDDCDMLAAWDYCDEHHRKDGE